MISTVSDFDPKMSLNHKELTTALISLTRDAILDIL